MDVSLIILLFIGFCMMYGSGIYLASLIRGWSVPIQKDYTYTPKVSIMLSAFNEGPAVYETVKSIKASNYPSDKIEIVAFNDCSRDDTWSWMEKAAADYEGVVIKQNPHNMGKAPTMAAASQFTTGDIIICTDADTVFDKEAIRELVCCFSDLTVGAVGGSIGIVNVNDTWLTQMQTIFYGTAYYAFKPMENINGATQCLGGPLVAFRRELYLDIVPDVISRNFFGEPLHNGEDRFITQGVLLRGWKTYTTLKAKCWVGTPVSWDTYFKQQLRWRRSAIGQFVFTLIDLPKYIRQAGALATIGSVFPIMSNIVWVLILMWLYMCGTLLPTLALLLALKVAILPVYGLIFNHIFSKIDPSQVVKNPILASTLIPIWFIISVVIVTPWALFTLDDGGWVTRQNGSNGNS